MFIITRKCACTFTEEKGCEACQYTGRREICIETDRKRAHILFRHWKRFYGADMKIKMKKGNV